MRALLLTLLFLPLGCEAANSPPIVLDGRFDDWTSVPAAVVDEADAPRAEVDFRAVRIADESDLVHVLLDLGEGRKLNIQRLDGCARLLLDSDGDPATGRTMYGLPGVDVIISLTPPPPPPEGGPGARNRPGMGVGLESTTYEGDPDDEMRPPLTPYDIGLALAPTYAGRFVELRIERGADLPNTPPFLTGDHFTARLVLVDRAGAVLDETDAFTHRLTPFAPPRPVRDEQQPDDPLARAPGTDLRLMTWNLQRGALLKQRDAALRILRAVQPDIICIQELGEEGNVDEVAHLLDAMNEEDGDEPNAQPWAVMFGAGGGDLRCAIATRLPISSNEHIEPIPHHAVEGWFLRTAGSIVHDNDRRVLVMSVHLKCCGRIGDESDRTRIGEAKAIRAALREALRATRFDGILIAGDMNLVGSRTPLDILAGRVAGAGPRLAVAEPMPLDGRSNATWRDPREPFVPGRLDFALYDGTAFEPARAFVLDGRDLAPRWLEHHGLRAADTAISDHLPIVVDLHRLDSALPEPGREEKRVH
ncbi:MAG: endonuclease/exonuclease/phosphatase family protein [Planctomycetota bacterium]|nr:endonuclease/exonuclease/phosphatase family protein [Planctomycetota bacterium]